MSTATLLGAIDNMTDTDPSEVKDELTRMFVKVSLALHRNEGDFTQEHHKALATAVGAFYDEEWVSSNDAETLFHDTYQRVYKKEMKQEEDAEDWNGDTDWRQLFTPKSVLVRIATAAALQDATNTKAWYAYCRANNIS